MKIIRPEKPAQLQKKLPWSRQTVYQTYYQRCLDFNNYLSTWLNCLGCEKDREGDVEKLKDYFNSLFQTLSLHMAKHFPDERTFYKPFILRHFIDCLLTCNLEEQDLLAQLKSSMRLVIDKRTIINNCLRWETIVTERLEDIASFAQNSVALSIATEPDDFKLLKKIKENGQC